MRSVAAVLLMAAVQAGTANEVVASANPIRKVVTLMQNMQKEITAEGEKQKELFDKFMCFCGGSSSDLERSAADSRSKIKEYTAKVASETAEKTQVAQDLVQHKKDRESATQDAKEAATIRAKENAEFSATAAESKTNVAAMANAIPALEKGMGAAALVQLPHGDRLHRLVESYPNVDADDRRTVLAFLDQSQDYEPQSGQIVGILKQMKDEMEADLKQATGEEGEAADSFKQLKASKDEEVKLASTAIETKTARAGELAVSVVQAQDALEDEQDELADAEKFSGNLREQCATKQKEWDAIVKTRNAEISAISEAIKILNDDDALDVFKKAIPSASALQTGAMGFLQRNGGRASSLSKARVLLAEMASRHPSPQLRLMLFTLNSKLRLKQRSHTKNFGEVIKMVDDMVTLLGKQQVEDDTQKEWCNVEFDKADDEEKATKSKISDIEAVVSEMTDSIAQVTQEITNLNAEIQSLDKTVAEATEQRKEEHVDYTEEVQMNEVAKQLVDKARNRMQKFYNPSLYKAPATTTPSASPYGLVQAPALLQIVQRGQRVAPPDAPEGPGAFKANSGSTGVIGMMDEIITDLDMSTQESQLEEKTAQKDYNTLMGDSSTKRAENAKSITNKEAAKAQLETKLQVTKESHRDANEDLTIVQNLIKSLHRSCDFLLSNYDVRKEARANEMDSLSNSKSVLAGANLGL